MKVSVILPSYRSAQELKQILPLFTSWISIRYDYEIIVVDDGSQDNNATELVAREYSCKFIRLDKNTGKGGAVRAGMLAACGDVRIFTDSDIPFEFDAIEKCVDYIINKEFHLAIGDRRLPDSNYYNKITGVRKFASQIFTFLVGRFITTGLFDTQCGLKGFSKTAATDLFRVAQLNGFAFDVELLYIALKRNYDIKRISVKFRSHQENSSINVFRHSLFMIIDLFKIKLYHLKGCYNKTAH